MLKIRIRVRVQTDCHKRDNARIRSCVCNAREEFDTRMQSEILECMKHTNVAKLYTAIVDLSNGVIPEDFPMPTQPEFRFKQSERANTAAEPAFQLSEDPVSVSSIATITPGVTINGQCLCTCSQSQHKSLHSFASSSDNDNYAGRLQSSSDQVDRQVDGNSGSTAASRGQHHQPLPAAYYNPQQQSSYARAIAAQQAAYYQQQQPAYYQQQQQPTSSALNTESGIANGFERFFSGLPPIR